MTTPLTIVISRSRYDEPARRALGEALDAALGELVGVKIVRLPHLYDLAPDGPSVEALRRAPGDLLLFAWLYPRAAFWVLDANGIHGQKGTTRLAPDDADEPARGRRDAQSGTPTRTIWCIDLRARPELEPYVAEVQRLLEATGRRPAATAATDATQPVNESPTARWYPVIDYARCTNCLECLNFCLFGVFGLDQGDFILVEQAEACRAGCPACSRICPADAILFPQHGDPAIAGDGAARGAAKPDLRQLLAGLSPEALAQVERQRALGTQSDDPLSRLVDEIDKMEG